MLRVYQVCIPVPELAREDPTDPTIPVWIAAPSLAAVQTYCEAQGWTNPAHEIPVVPTKEAGVDVFLNEKGEIDAYY